MKRGIVASFILFLLVSPQAWSVETRLFVRPWCDLEPFVRVGADEYPLTREKAAARILEEARVLFSAMVYGYRFVYTPSDAARKVQERFELEPVAEIPWGARGVRILDTAQEDKRLYARLSFTLSDPEIKRRRAWESSAVEMSTGNGSGSLFAGYTDKITAFRNALKDAVRAYLHTRVLNKPREVRGEVVLWDDPRVVERAGQYWAQVKVKLTISEIVPYRIF